MIARHAPFLLLVGLCVLVPIPFLDKWMERRLTRALFARVAEERQIRLDSAALHTLTDDPSPFLRGCLYACLFWPIKKLFSSIVFVFIVKQGVDLGARALVRGEMLNQAIDRGLFSEPDRLTADAAAVRAAMDETLAEVPTSPIGRLLRRSRNPVLPPDGPHPTSRWLRKLHEWSGGGEVIPRFAGKLDAVGASPRAEP